MKINKNISFLEKIGTFLQNYQICISPFPFPISWLPECVDVDNVIELMIL